MKPLKTSQLKEGNIYHCLLADMPVIVISISDNSARVKFWNTATNEYCYTNVGNGHLVDDVQEFVNADAIQHAPYVFDFTSGPVNAPTPIKCEFCAFPWEPKLRPGQTNIKCPNCKNNTEITEL